MTSSANNKKCGVCSVNVGVGQGQAIFTAECSHAFHFPCISTFINNGNRICPLCSAAWNNLPFIPNPNPNPIPIPAAIPTRRRGRPSLFRQPASLRYHPYNLNLLTNPYHLNHLTDPTPPEECYDDDEPLPNANANVHDLILIDSDAADLQLQKVQIKTIPEYRAVPAPVSVPQFAVLVGLIAPPLPDARAPVDIVAVLDVSGSMVGEKLNLVKSAMHFVIDNLGASDRLSVVSFSSLAHRVLPLRRMTVAGREEAKCAVDNINMGGATKIVRGLKKGAQVLEQRRHKNPVTSIIFLSDGNDDYNLRRAADPGYEHLLPASINGGAGAERQGTIPVHSFGFGSDHDPLTMHAISDASGGTFSFVESVEMIQDAFAGCIGGLLSVVAQELTLKLRSASPGVKIKSISSGRCRSEVSKGGPEGLINVGELYADEKKAFLMYVSVPVCKKGAAITSLLDITCTYRDAISKKIVVIAGHEVEIGRPKFPSSEDRTVNLEVDRERNRIRAAESIKQAQQLAEKGKHAAAKKLLEEKRSDLMATASGKAGDGMTKWLEGEMRETGMRMRSAMTYQQSGRAYALSGMSSLANQRATTRGGAVAGASLLPMVCPPPPGASSGCSGGAGGGFGGYATPQMGIMVLKSMQQSKNKNKNKSKSGVGITNKY